MKKTKTSSLLPESVESSRQCAYSDNGQRCQSDGGLSLGIGENRTKYCRQHFRVIMGWDGEKSVVDRTETIANLKRLLKRVNVAPGVRDLRWAECIEQRIEQGIEVSPAARAMALEALGAFRHAPAATREPGEEG